MCQSTNCKGLPGPRSRNWSAGKIQYFKFQDFKNTSYQHSHNQMKTTNDLSGDNTCDSCFLSTDQDACKTPSTPSNVMLSFPFASLVLEKHHQEKGRTGYFRVVPNELWWRCYECKSVRPDAQHSIWARSLQSDETVRMRWHPALITSSCSTALLGNGGEMQWPPSPGRTEQGWIPFFPLLLANTPPPQNGWFHSWGPSIKQAEQASTTWSVMSEHVDSNWQLIFHPESKNRRTPPSKSQSETTLNTPSHGQLCWDLCVSGWWTAEFP